MFGSRMLDFVLVLFIVCHCLLLEKMWAYRTGALDGRLVEVEMTKLK